MFTAIYKGNGSKHSKVAGSKAAGRVRVTPYGEGDKAGMTVTLFAPGEKGRRVAALRMSQSDAEALVFAINDAVRTNEAAELRLPSALSQPEAEVEADDGIDHTAECAPPASTRKVTPADLPVSDAPTTSIAAINNPDPFAGEPQSIKDEIAGLLNLL